MSILGIDHAELNILELHFDVLLCLLNIDDEGGKSVDKLVGLCQSFSPNMIPRCYRDLANLEIEGFKTI